MSHQGNSEREKRRSSTGRRQQQQQQEQLLDPFDMNGPDFNPDLFLNKMLKEQNLSDLLESEVSLYKSIGSLDSEMQTLVYENYNKFISATDTITKMSKNFDEIEDELEKLSGKIAQITSSSSQVSDCLKEKRTNLSKLSSTFVLLQKLDFLFQLPVKMSTMYSEKKYVDAVKCYLQSKSTLKQYQHFPSISIIDKECQALLVKLKEKLHESFTTFDQEAESGGLDVTAQTVGQVSPKSSPFLGDSETADDKVSERNRQSDNSMATIIGLLLQLNENPDFLSFRFLKYSTKKLDTKLAQLDYYISMNEKLLKKRLKTSITKDGGDRTDDETSNLIQEIDDEMADLPVDVLEFVDTACNGLLSQLVSTVHSFDHLFVSKGDALQPDSSLSKNLTSNNDSLMQFVDKYMNDFMDRIKIRLNQESINETDFKYLSRSLDRFHRRVISVRKVLPNHDYCHKSNQVINEVIDNLIVGFRSDLEKHFMDQIVKIRQLIVSANDPNSVKDSIKSLICEFEMITFDGISSAISSLVTFLDPGLQFSKEGNFESQFLIKVKEDVIMNLISSMVKTLDSYSTSSTKSTPPPILVLILSKISFNFDQFLITKIANLIEDDLKLQQKIPRNIQANHVTQLNAIKKECMATSHKLLVHYVIVEGHNLSQMIRKSVETRDWLSSIEPRSVRPVMKRVVEDVVSIDAVVSQLYEEGFLPKTASSTGSSSRGRFSSSIKKGQTGFGAKKLTTSSSGHHLLSHGNPYTNTSHLSGGQSLNQSFDMINISKFLSEKIELNLSKLEAEKVSIMTAIIKIMLKSLIEVIRLSTFSRFGLQQIQVDCFYLQMFCWKYVSDETIVYNLLEDAIQAAINRCLDPLLMEMSIVESICEGAN